MKMLHYRSAHTHETCIPHRTLLFVKTAVFRQLLVPETPLSKPLTKTLHNERSRKMEKKFRRHRCAIDDILDEDVIVGHTDTLSASFPEE